MVYPKKCLSKMKNSLVVKDNALIDASFNLSLIEQRLMLLAIIEAREINNLTPSTRIEIKAQTYSKQFNVDESASYKSLASAGKTLKRREFTYKDRYKDHDARTVAGWVNSVTYVEKMGVIAIKLSEEVIAMISRLEDQFTRYHLEQVSKFNSKYSIRLYELVSKWLAVGQTEKYEISDLREKLGVGKTEYKTMSLFKTNVLDKAVAEINSESDLKVDYEQFRTGRAISHISLSVKPKHVIKTIDLPKEPTFNLTPKQLDLFARKLALDSVFGGKYAAVGETTDDFEIRVRALLESKETRLQFKDHLIRLGYSEKAPKS